MDPIVARLERIPLSRPHMRLLFQGGLGYTYDAANSGIVAFLMPVLATLWGLSHSETGLLGSSTFIGYLFGALTAGYIGDRYGRKVVMMVALGIYCLATLIAATSVNWPEFFALHIVAGYGTGAESAIIAPFLSEFVPSRQRGRYVGVVAGFFSFGFVVSALLGLLIPVSGGWRWVQVIAAVPVLMLLVWRRAIPESPRFLLSNGRREEAERVVSRLEREYEAIGRTLPPVSVAAAGTGAIAPARRQGLLRSTASLFAAGSRRRMIGACVVWLVQTFSYYGFITWIPSLLVDRGFDISKSFTFSLLIYIMMVPGYFTAAFLNDRLDRKWVVAVYLTGGGLSALVLAFAASNSVILGAGMALSFFLNGVYAGLYSYTPELFPTRIRATGMATVSAVARLGAIFAPIIIGSAYTVLGFGGVFAMMLVVLAVGVLVIVVFGVPTAGRTLEELTEGAVGSAAGVQPGVMT
jgi:MFS transporter, putative metabolite:H+ symporter